MRWALTALVLLLQGLPPAGTVDVQAREGLVTIRAHRVPLSRILERLAQQTGMKVTYESGVPGHLVTTALDRLSHTEALTRIFEGLGMSYVFRTDATGQRVEALIVSEGGAAPGAPRTVTQPRPVMEFPPEMVDDQSSYEEPPMEFTQPEMAPPPVPAVEAQVPPPDFQKVFPPGSEPGSPNLPGMPAPPMFPGPVSNPFPQ